MQALAHACKPDATLRARAPCRPAARNGRSVSVVPDRQSDVPPAIGPIAVQLDVRCGAAGMPRHVAQGFLHDAKQRSSTVGIGDRDGRNDQIDEEPAALGRIPRHNAAAPASSPASSSSGGCSRQDRVRPLPIDCGAFVELLVDGFAFRAGIDFRMTLDEQAATIRFCPVVSCRSRAIRRRSSVLRAQHRPGKLARQLLGVPQIVDGRAQQQPGADRPIRNSWRASTFISGSDDPTNRLEPCRVRQTRTTVTTHDGAARAFRAEPEPSPTTRLAAAHRTRRAGSCFRGSWHSPRTPPRRRRREGWSTPPPRRTVGASSVPRSAGLRSSR